MSTGFECHIRELTPGAWYYILQHWDCPVGAWDWTEHASVTGPFASDEAALTHLHDHEANPGGYSTIPYDAARATKNAALLAKARRPAPARSWGYR